MKKEWLMTLPAILIVIVIIAVWSRIGNDAAQGPDQQSGTVSEAETEQTEQTTEETEQTTGTETTQEETTAEASTEEPAAPETETDTSAAPETPGDQTEQGASIRAGLIPSVSIAFRLLTEDGKDQENPELILGVYRPAQDGGNIELKILKDGAFLQTLEDPALPDAYSGMRFDAVTDVRAEDTNGDGYTDLRIRCSYVGAGDNRGQSLTRERVYLGAEGPVYTLERDPAVDVVYADWKEAYAAYIRSDAAADYDGFVLFYLNEDNIPEMAAADTTGERGLSVLFYRDGRWVEKRFLRQTVYYLEKENLLCDSSGIMDRFYDTVYSISGGRLNTVAEGTYGLPDDAPAGAGEESYTYVWSGAEVSAAGYRDGLAFLFDKGRAHACTEGMVSGEDLLTDLQQ